MLEWFLLFLQIMIINIVLSGDNALVIALASKNLDKKQSQKAVWWGAIGAVVLRILLTIIAIHILNIPYIQSIGSLLLLWIAFKLLNDNEEHKNIKEASTLWNAILTIIVADFVMSMDNVLAIAAKANGNISIIIAGIALSIPIIIWGSNLVMKLLNKFPIFIWIGAGILGYTAGEMFVKDKKVGEYISHSFHWTVPIVAMLLILIIGFIKKQVKLERV